LLNSFFIHISYIDKLSTNNIIGDFIIEIAKCFNQDSTYYRTQEYAKYPLNQFDASIIQSDLGFTLVARPNETINQNTKNQM